jgi:hypothetical protein
MAFVSAPTITGVRIFHQIGGALGTAVLAVILQHSLPATPEPERTCPCVRDHVRLALGLTVLSFVPAMLLPGRGHQAH